MTELCEAEYLRALDLLATQAAEVAKGKTKAAKAAREALEGALSDGYNASRLDAWRKFRDHVPDGMQHSMAWALACKFPIPVWDVVDRIAAGDELVEHEGRAALKSADGNLYLAVRP